MVNSVVCYPSCPIEIETVSEKPVMKREQSKKKKKGKKIIPQDIPGGAYDLDGT